VPHGGGRSNRPTHGSGRLPSSLAKYHAPHWSGRAPWMRAHRPQVAALGTQYGKSWGNWAGDGTWAMLPTPVGSEGENLCSRARTNSNCAKSAHGSAACRLRVKGDVSPIADLAHARDGDPEARRDDLLAPASARSKGHWRNRSRGPLRADTRALAFRLPPSGSVGREFGDRQVPDKSRTRLLLPCWRGTQPRRPRHA
jgi:hypothetical protein